MLNPCIRIAFTLKFSSGLFFNMKWPHQTGSYLFMAEMNPSVKQESLSLFTFFAVR